MNLTVEPIPPAVAPPEQAGGGASTRHLSPAAMLLSAVAVGCALQVNFGQYHPAALLWLTVALGGAVVSILVPHHPLPKALDARPALVSAAALAVQLVLLLGGSPGASGRLATGDGVGIFRLGAAAGVVFAVASVASAGRRWGTVCVVGMLLAHALLGLWVLRAAPGPAVDVVIFQREGAAALVRGENPYAITFPSPYADGSPFYGPGLVDEQRLLFGYPYPPLSLLLVTPAHLAGDFRYAHWAAMTLAGALVAAARPRSRWGAAAAGVLLFTPRGFFVLEAGWTEPLAVLLLALAVFLACRRHGPAPLALGLLIAVKQYLLLALLVAPLLPVRATRHRRKVIVTALAVAVTVTLPFALWDVGAFVHSAVLLQFRQPFRDDALSYLVAVANVTGWRPPAWVPFAVVPPAAWLALRKLPRTPSGFAAGLALVSFAFFAFNKQAFCNYYHLVLGALCCAAGAHGAVPWADPEGASKTA